MTVRHLATVFVVSAAAVGLFVHDRPLTAAAPQPAQAAPADPVLSPGPSAARYPKNEAEFDEYFNKIKNWGRWGAADELGTLNLITEAKRKQAGRLVKVGQSVGLAHTPVTE